MSGDGGGGSGRCSSQERGAVGLGLELRVCDSVMRLLSDGETLSMFILFKVVIDSRDKIATRSPLLSAGLASPLLISDSR